MLLVKYNERVMLDPFRCRDIEKSVKFHKVEFHGGLLYGYRSAYAVQTISEDEVVSIDDLNNPGACVDVPASFKAGELAYTLPF